MTPRRPLRGSASLKRVAKPRTPEPVRPEDYATPERPIGMCRNCGHHTSAFCGACTAFVLDGHGVPTWCGCNCQAHLSEPTVSQPGAEGPERSDPKKKGTAPMTEGNPWRDDGNGASPITDPGNKPDPRK